MSQLSEVTESRIGTTIFTATGLTGATKARVVFRTANWSPILRTVVPGIELTETQEYNRGGASGTLNWPVELYFEWCPDALRAALAAQHVQLGATFDAVLVLAATDGSGAERSLSFSALRFASLTFDTTARFGSRTYRGVLATLTSEA